ncbi:protein tyrosine phosphatase family protein [Leptolyngbya sp. AN03gr2]|uniref:protein tyrosine phosphatase family protein n=1 Tax=unclassified Leptolyngbya TaxID=2650499 RepID=UPI003D317F06
METIQNFVQINDRLATAGQPTIKQFTAIRDAGYTVVINLAVPTSEGAIANERQIVESLGMQYFHIPVVWDNPTIDDFNQFSNVMQTHSDQSVFVHCAKNMRVSAFVYLYRRSHENMSEEEARADLIKIWQPNPTWQTFMRTVLS